MAFSFKFIPLMNFGYYKYQSNGCSPASYCCYDLFASVEGSCLRTIANFGRSVDSIPIFFFNNQFLVISETLDKG